MGKFLYSVVGFCVLSVLHFSELNAGPVGSQFCPFVCDCKTDPDGSVNLVECAKQRLWVNGAPGSHPLNTVCSQLYTSDSEPYCACAGLCNCQPSSCKSGNHLAAFQAGLACYNQTTIQGYLGCVVSQCNPAIGYLGNDLKPGMQPCNGYGK